MARMLAHTTPRPTIRLIRQCEFRARCIATTSDMAHIMELVCLLLQIRFSYYVYYIGKNVQDPTGKIFESSLKNFRKILFKINVLKYFFLNMFKDKNES